MTGRFAAAAQADALREAAALIEQAGTTASVSVDPAEGAGTFFITIMVRASCGPLAERVAAVEHLAAAAGTPAIRIGHPGSLATSTRRGGYRVNIFTANLDDRP